MDSSLGMCMCMFTFCICFLRSLWLLRGIDLALTNSSIGTTSRRLCYSNFLTGAKYFLKFHYRKFYFLQDICRKVGIDVDCLVCRVNFAVIG